MNKYCQAKNLEELLQIEYGKRGTEKREAFEARSNAFYHKEMLERMTKLMRKTITVEQLEQEQNRPSFSKEEYEQMVKDLNIQEPIEDLMKMLKK